MMDPGLRREMAAMIPAAVRRGIFSTPRAWQLTPSGARQPVRPPRTKPARSGRTRRRDETLLAGCHDHLVDERRIAGIDDLFIELDPNWSGSSR